MTVLKAQSEAAFQQALINYATLMDFSVYHTHDSRRSQPGFPDLTLVRGPELIFAELKSERGRVRPEQTAWLEKLRQVPGIDVYLWRPSHWPEIEARLSRGRHRIERAA